MRPSLSFMALQGQPNEKFSSQTKLTTGGGGNFSPRNKTHDMQLVSNFTPTKNHGRASGSLSDDEVLIDQSHGLLGLCLNPGTCLAGDLKIVPLASNHDHVCSIGAGNRGHVSRAG